MIKAEVIFDEDKIYVGKFKIIDVIDTWDIYIEDEYQTFCYALEDAIAYCMGN